MKAIKSLFDPAHIGHSTHVIPCEGRSAERVWVSKKPMPTECRKLLIAGAQVHNNEVCGFITREWMIFPVHNVHLEPRHNYYFDIEDTNRVLAEIYGKYETEIIGQYHSHPNDVPWPSPRDLVGWPNPELNWRYWIVTNLEVIEWKLVEDNGDG
jgi:proteasome lid subunit RPN8/RPN11